jgi:hypothetical protein
MCASVTSSYVNYMTIVMILYVVYNEAITSGKSWFLLIPNHISTKK